MRVLGIMSGTSIDSVDYAICEIAGAKTKLLEYWQVGFPAKLQESLKAAAANQLTTYEIGQLHHDLGRFYAKGAGKAKVELAGLHGQTVFHNPQPPGATYQIGEPVYLAQGLKAPVVSNFRAADLAAGGQGAPLATVFHQALFARRGKHIAVHNLGGISNVTSLDWTGKKLKIKSFDTGPANMLIDLAVQKLSGGRKQFDRNGSWARKGKSNHDLLVQLLQNPFYLLPPPKSTGREMFGSGYLEEVFRLAGKITAEDLLATLTMLTPASIAANYVLHLDSPPDEVIFCGGGASNTHMMFLLEACLPQCKVVTVQSKGWPAQSIEPAAFALLAWLRIKGKPGNIPETTGASREVLCGQITEP